MKKSPQFLKTTLIGGILYLVPTVVALVIAGKAFAIVHKLVKPLAAQIPATGLFGIAMSNVLAVVAIVLFCFLTGLFARTVVARRFSDWLESTVLVNVPGYAVMKSIGDSVAGAERANGQEAVLARIEDAWQIAFVVERIEVGQVAVYVPGAPDVSSGSVYFMTEDRVKPLGGSLTDAAKCLRRLGVGSSALLAGKL